jgi:lipopolysaccharide biosynthesis regulator YciM
MTVTLESLRKSIGKKKVNTQAFAWLADFERESGDLDTSLERVDGGLTLYPRDLAARLVRTKILFEKENYEGCIEECAKVLKMDPFCLSA